MLALLPPRPAEGAAAAAGAAAPACSPAAASIEVGEPIFSDESSSGVTVRQMIILGRTDRVAVS